MLTITETMDAISNLDTDPDIILGACKKLVESSKPKTEASASLAVAILEPWLGKTEISELIMGLTEALAAVAAGSVKFDKEEEVLTKLINTFADLYSNICANRFHERLKANPAEAKQELLERLHRLGLMK